jgi:hypothetical protein
VLPGANEIKRPEKLEGSPVSKIKAGSQGTNLRFDFGVLVIA